MAQGYDACGAHETRPDSDCYCRGEAVANRSKDNPAALGSEFEAAALRRCGEPQAVRVTQYDRCMQVYGAFVEGRRLAQAEAYCGCVAGYAVAHWRQRPLPQLRMDGIAACQRLPGRQAS